MAGPNQLLLIAVDLPEEDKSNMLGSENSPDGSPNRRNHQRIEQLAYARMDLGPPHDWKALMPGRALQPREAPLLSWIWVEGTDEGRMFASFSSTSSPCGVEQPSSSTSMFWFALGLSGEHHRGGHGRTGPSSCSSHECYKGRERNEDGNVEGGLPRHRSPLKEIDCGPKS